MSITLIMLRHATREPCTDPDANKYYLDRNLPLNAAGEAEAKLRALDMVQQGIKPAVYLTSCFVHARQTGEIMRDTIDLDPPASVVELLTLTPYFQGPRRSRGNWQGSHMLESISEESRLTGNDLRRLNTVAFILHQPRLDQLLEAMNLHSQLPSNNIIDYSEGIICRADSLDGLLRGYSKLIGRVGH